jgi:hypothetical protein
MFLGASQRRESTLVGEAVKIASSLCRGEGREEGGGVRMEEGEGVGEEKEGNKNGRKGRRKGRRNGRRKGRR